MRLWRISNYADLSGQGGRIAAGRWNRLGRLAVYLADHPALALLETLVHLEIDADDMPSRFRLLTVEAPDGIAPAEWTEAGLDASVPDWRRNPETTRALAEDFFATGRHALMRVPSVLVPEAWNFILNPTHADAGRLRIVSDVQVAFDERLLSSGQPSPSP